ncbi:MAG: hypothetical protein Q8O82_19870 [Pseudorhodobacter sp.]|nr:hypothetical protein [Pseudorhodobacter sp.]
MNLYHCMIELKSDAKALTFAGAVEAWMAALLETGDVLGWRLLRRKLGLASGQHTDFLLEIEVEDLAGLERAFRSAGQCNDSVARHFELMHAMIGRLETGLYRPFPGQEHRERIALI